MRGASRVHVHANGSPGLVVRGVAAVGVNVCDKSQIHFLKIKKKKIGFFFFFTLALGVDLMFSKQDCLDMAKKSSGFIAARFVLVCVRAGAPVHLML